MKRRCGRQESGTTNELLERLLQCLRARLLGRRMSSGLRVMLIEVIAGMLRHELNVLRSSGGDHDELDTWNFMRRKQPAPAAAPVRPIAANATAIAPKSIPKPSKQTVAVAATAPRATVAPASTSTGNRRDSGADGWDFSHQKPPRRSTTTATTTTATPPPADDANGRKVQTVTLAPTPIAQPTAPLQVLTPQQQPPPPYELVATTASASMNSGSEPTAAAVTAAVATIASAAARVAEAAAEATAAANTVVMAAGRAASAAAVAAEAATAATTAAQSATTAAVALEAAVAAATEARQRRYGAEMSAGMCSLM